MFKRCLSALAVLLVAGLTAVTLLDRPISANSCFCPGTGHEETCIGTDPGGNCAVAGSACSSTCWNYGADDCYPDSICDYWSEPGVPCFYVGQLAVYQCIGHWGCEICE